MWFGGTLRTDHDDEGRRVPVIRSRNLALSPTTTMSADAAPSPLYSRRVQTLLIAGVTAIFVAGSFSYFLASRHSDRGAPSDSQGKGKDKARTFLLPLVCSLSCVISILRGLYLACGPQSLFHLLISAKAARRRR